MKKIMEIPTIRVVRLELADIITSSPGSILVDFNDAQTASPTVSNTVFDNQLGNVLWGNDDD